MANPTTLINPIIEDLIFSLTNSDEHKDVFSDTDGLISFVNLKNSAVAETKEFKIGQSICDKLANFYGSLNQGVFDKLKNPKQNQLNSDLPKTKWDPQIAEYIFDILYLAGGLTTQSEETKTHTETQLLSEFSTDFVKLIFDAATVPDEAIKKIVAYLEGVGRSIRAGVNRDNKAFSIGILSQCHEAVPIDESNYRYFPKIKYLFIRITASHSEFTTTCNRTKKINFNFEYTNCVAALAKDVLNKKTKTHKKFKMALDRAQEANHKKAMHRIEELLPVTSEELNVDNNNNNPTANVFEVDLSKYPEVKL